MLVVVSDLHVNSKLGLWNPDTVLDEGGKYDPSPAQKWLWGKWQESCKWTRGLGKTTIIINGDWINGLRSKDGQLVSVDRTEMQKAAEDVVAPLIEKAERIYVIRGTDFHEGAGGQDIEAVAKTIGAERNRAGQYSRWELWIEHEGLLYHFTHHISIAPVYPLTRMYRELQFAKQNLVDHGLPVPNVMVRSHRHQYNFVGDTFGHWLFVTPAWQLKTAYLYKQNPQAVPHVGCLAFHSEKGELRWQANIHPLPKPNIVK